MDISQQICGLHIACFFKEYTVKLNASTAHYLKKENIELMSDACHRFDLMNKLGDAIGISKSETMNHSLRFDLMKNRYYGSVKGKDHQGRKLNYLALFLMLIYYNECRMLTFHM